ncbi:MAG: kinase-like domain-containing protein [Piptocephalis tieghemiana]|nr:MAG: kinase-like domain-containing protein [Piptocephalis tieghemiana]
MKPKMSMSLKGMGVTPLADDSSPFSNFSKFVDPSGKLKFDGKAVIHSKGVDFSNGTSFNINMDELNLLEDLGKGQYGVVKKVFHRPTNVTMAMKEIRLELDQARLNQILMELDVLHKAEHPSIVAFYGAFFIESCVYYCMEYMDAGSLDTLFRDQGVPEDVLSQITLTMLQGLRFLKDEHSIIHRDIKPTNVLVNSDGEVKLCDFGVSGQLIQSMARTHIGCQPYMAPERITSSQAGPYTASSDVWSLGVTLAECARGTYPYTADTVFAQLSAIVQGAVPRMPESFSEESQDFLAQCLQKNPQDRPTFSQLLDHPWLSRYSKDEVDIKGWVKKSMEAKRLRGNEGCVPASAPRDIIT